MRGAKCEESAENAGYRLLMVTSHQSPVELVISLEGELLVVCPAYFQRDLTHSTGLVRVT